jgi:hypothetical protein
MIYDEQKPEADRDQTAQCILKVWIILKIIAKFIMDLSPWFVSIKVKPEADQGQNAQSLLNYCNF